MKNQSKKPIKSMKLDQLPVEMLMEIFRYIPTYHDVSLVNKLFYGIACKMNDPNICLRLYWDFFKFYEDMENFQYLQNLNRQITKVQIFGKNDHCQIKNDLRIISVAVKFSETIKFLQSAYLTIHESTLLDVVAFSPNIEHLHLHQVELTTDGHSSMRRVWNDDRSLPKLKSMTIYGCDDKFVGFFNRLPAGILTKLRITSVDWSIFGILLRRQWNIKKLELTNYLAVNDITTILYDGPHLESLKLDVFAMDRATSLAILSKLNKLKSLTFRVGCGAFDEQIMNAIADLSELEVLDMYVKQIPSTSFVQIRKLKKLRHLKLRGYDIESTALERLATSNNTSIQKLSLRCKTLSMTLIAKLAESTPNLSHIDLTHSEILDSTELDAIMSHFNSVEVLKIVMRNEPLGGNAGDYFNPKLRKLVICDKSDISHFNMWLTKLINSYPNLKKLKLISFSSELSLEIRSIIDGFVKLETMIVRAKRPVIVDDLVYLADHKGNLKFVSWGQIDDRKLMGKLIRKLSYNYGLVCENHGGILNVAVDRYTMNCERSIYKLL